MHIGVSEAVTRIRGGEIVAIPTDTVYGLACDFRNSEALANLFSLKQRPTRNPLLILAADLHDIENYLVTEPKTFYKLADEFWPGGLTLVLPVDQGLIPALVRANLPTAGFRVPNHPDAQQLLAKTGPLVAPSANLSGFPSATQPQHVEADFGPEFPLIDGGPCDKGVESTILIYEEGKWLCGRLGAVSLEAIEEILGYRPALVEGPASALPHYKPHARLIAGTSGTVIGFSDRQYPRATRVIAVGPSTDPDQALHGLYAALRQLDAEGIAEACLDLALPATERWRTYRDRIQSAIKPF